MTLDEIREPCSRLSVKNRCVIRAYIDALIAKVQETIRRLLEVEMSLEDKRKSTRR